MPLPPLAVPRSVDMAQRHRIYDLRRCAPVLMVGALLSLVASGILGFAAAGGFLILATAAAVVRPRVSAEALARYLPLLALSLLAMASTLWSDAPQRTLRAALQLTLTMVAAVVMCRQLSARAMVLTLFIGFGTIALVALAYVPAYVAAHLAIFRPMGSKNALGYAAQMLVALALAVAADRENALLWRAVALVAVPTSLLLVYLSQSAGAATATVITLVTFPALALCVRLPLRLRLGLVAAAAFLGIVASFFLPEIGALIASVRENVLHKDATLTGRTYLWEFARRISGERPLLGMGYYAFWRPGNIDAEGLWRWGGIATRSGFNFHNAFVEMRVDLGLVGQGVMIATCAVVAIAALSRQIVRPTIPMAFLIAMLIVNYVRSFAEDGLIAPFAVPTVLWLATLIYAFTPAEKKATAMSRPRATTPSNRRAWTSPRAVPVAGRRVKR